MKRAYTVTAYVNVSDTTGNPIVQNPTAKAYYALNSSPVAMGHVAAVNHLLAGDSMSAALEGGGHETHAWLLHITFLADDLDNATDKIDGVLSKTGGILGRTTIEPAKPGRAI